MSGGRRTANGEERNDGAIAELQPPASNPQSEGSALDLHFMSRALELARQAQAAGEVPVGAVIVKDGEIIAEGWNRPISTCDPTAHAEMVAIRAAGQKLNTYRLLDTTLYVTLEPCAMCAAAISLARIGKLNFGAEDPKGGGVVHGARIFAQPTCHHRPDILSGIGEAEAAEQLRAFFAERR